MCCKCKLCSGVADIQKPYWNTVSCVMKCIIFHVDRVRVRPLHRCDIGETPCRAKTLRLQYIMYAFHLASIFKATTGLSQHSYLAVLTSSQISPAWHFYTNCASKDFRGLWSSLGQASLIRTYRHSFTQRLWAQPGSSDTFNQLTLKSHIQEWREEFLELVER